jgi:hypothetical protein
MSGGQQPEQETLPSEGVAHKATNAHTEEPVDDGWSNTEIIALCGIGGPVLIALFVLLGKYLNRDKK